jgi:uncharacterized protein (TIGR04255 family)
VVARGTPLPIKLRNDAIVEAIFEIRFDMTTVPEVLIGRISEFGKWKNLAQRRMPGADIPAQLRLMNPLFRSQPIIEFADDSAEPFALRLGPNSLAFHRIRRYVGWERFRKELAGASDVLFKKADGLVISRLGLRYLNALTSDIHKVGSLADLDVSLSIAGDQPMNKLNLNYTMDLGNETACSVRLATADMVQGALPTSSTVFVDVEVFTNEGYKTERKSDVDAWLEFAHNHEKQEFFHLLRQETITGLEEK